MNENIPQNYNIIFKGSSKTINLTFKLGTKISDIMKEYYKAIKKENLLIKNFENIYFVSNAKMLNNFPDKPIEYLYDYVIYNTYSVQVINGRENNYKLEKMEIIKENFISGVYKAMIEGKYVAVKKIFKDKLKEELQFSLMKDEITDEDFKPEIVKFNKELENMQKCSCENSVEIYDFYETEKEFIIIMELCDDTLFKLLCKKPAGFKVDEIKKILKQLNNVFKIMNLYKISHRDIKLDNILVKYLNKEKKEYKVLLSDYGISNQLSQISTKFKTHAGTQLIMAPEILNDEEYTNKCDLWSIGVVIYQLITKNYPYKGSVEKAILKKIENDGLKVLDSIKTKNEEEEKLKDLLSKLLIADPEKRISWEDYFNHPFFK